MFIVDGYTHHHHHNHHQHHQHHLRATSNCRSVLRAGDLVTFDNMVSGRELHAIEERSRTMNLAEDGEYPEGYICTHTPCNTDIHQPKHNPYSYQVSISFLT